MLTFLRKNSWDIWENNIQASKHFHFFHTKDFRNFIKEAAFNKSLSNFLDRTACHSFTKLLHKRHLADQYQSVTSMSSSLNLSHYTGHLPAATHTASHADLPTHSSLTESVSSLPWLTCRLHFATLRLDSNHHTAPAVSWSFEKKKALLTNQHSETKGVGARVCVSWPQSPALVVQVLINRRSFYKNFAGEYR